jgi:hypothetical protein
MFAVLHSDINSLKSGLLYLTGQPYCKNGRSAKVKDGIINLSLRNYLVDRYNLPWFDQTLRLIFIYLLNQYWTLQQKC